VDQGRRHCDLDGDEVSARAIPATIAVDRMTTHANLAEFAHFAFEIDGSQPFVRVVRIDAPCAPADLLPAGSVVERCVTSDTSVVVLARLRDATVMVQAFPRASTIHVSAESHARADQVAAEVHAKAPEPLSGTTTVRVWHHNCDRAPTSADRNIEAPRWVDIAANYPSTARAAVTALREVVRPIGAGKLVLWHGPPGTGKTTALRALMREWSSWCQPQYIADPEVFFAEPAYMTYVLTTAPVARVGPTLTAAGQPEAIWRLVIAEDSDEYLRATARRDAGAALGRLLNLADGILGQGMNVLVLLTTNEETSRLHPALVRPGRCLAAIEFPAFDQHDASQWLGQPVDVSMTLAELLEQRGDIGRVGAPPRRLEPIGQYL